jgi:hypothetical protein
VHVLVDVGAVPISNSDAGVYLDGLRQIVERGFVVFELKVQFTPIDIGVGVAWAYNEKEEEFSLSGRHLYIPVENLRFSFFSCLPIGVR